MNVVPMNEKLHAYIKDHMIVQNDIARAIGTSPQRLSMILKGDIKFSVDDFEKIIKYLDVSWETIENYEAREK